MTIRIERGDYVRCLSSNVRGVRVGQVLPVLQVASGGDFVKVPNHQSQWGYAWMPADCFELVQRAVPAP